MAATKYTAVILLAVMLLAGGASAARDLLQNTCPGGMGGLLSGVCINLQNLVNVCNNNAGNCCLIGSVNAGILGAIGPNVGNCGGAAAGRRLQQLEVVDGVVTEVEGLVTGLTGRRLQQLGTVTGLVGGLTGGLTGAATGGATAGGAAGTANNCPAGMVGGVLSGVCVNAQQVANICEDNTANCCLIGSVNVAALAPILGPAGNCGARR